MNSDVLIVYLGGVVWYAIVGTFLYQHFGRYAGINDTLDKMIWLGAGVFLGLILAKADYLIVEAGALPFLLGEMLSAIFIIGMFSTVERVQTAFNSFLLRRLGIPIAKDNEVVIVTPKDDQGNSVD